MKYSQYINAFYEQMKHFGVNPTMEEVALIFENTYRKSFKKGEIILKQGDYCNHAYFITKGLVRSFNVLPNGTEKTYLIWRENYICTEHSSFMSKKPSNDFLEALEDTDVLVTSHEILMSLYRDYHNWETMGRKISDKSFIVSLARLKSLMNEDAEQRYSTYLKTFRNVLDRVPQNVAASYIGITPQSFSRLKKQIGE
jgi:CRP-like cAMP-binding protein